MCPLLFKAEKLIKKLVCFVDPNWSGNNNIRKTGRGRKIGTNNKHYLITNGSSRSFYSTSTEISLLLILVKITPAFLSAPFYILFVTIICN